MLSALPIGVFDSGLGGLTVLRSLRAELPNETFLYLGDTARTPYGPKNPETVRQYSRECARFLCGHGIKLLVVACNTASAFACEALRSEIALPVVFATEPAIHALGKLPRAARVGVIGTRGTIASQVFQRGIQELRPDLQVMARACPLFVPLVEEGLFRGAMVNQALDLYLKEIRDWRPDVLVLGCTHYPVLVGAISEFLGDSVSIIECSREIALECHTVLANGHSLSSQKSGDDRLYITEALGMFESLAKNLLGDNEVSVSKVEIA